MKNATTKATETETIRRMISTYHITIVGDNLKVEMFASPNKAAHCEFIKAHKAEIIAYIKADEAEKAAFSAKLKEAKEIIKKESPELMQCKPIFDTCAHSIAKGAEVKTAIIAARQQMVNYWDSKF